MTRALAFAWLIVAACGKHAEPTTDWSQTPLDQTIESDVDGIRFRIQLPNGYKADTFDGGSGTRVMTRQWIGPGPHGIDAPIVKVEVFGGTPPDLDEFSAWVLQYNPRHTITKQAKLADGLVVVSRTSDNTEMRADVMKPKREAWIACSAWQSYSDAPDPDARMAWLERVCETLAIE